MAVFYNLKSTLKTVDKTTTNIRLLNIVIVVLHRWLKLGQLTYQQLSGKTNTRQESMNIYETTMQPSTIEQQRAHRLLGHINTGNGHLN